MIAHRVGAGQFSGVLEQPRSPREALAAPRGQGAECTESCTSER